MGVDEDYICALSTGSQVREEETENPCLCSL